MERALIIHHRKLRARKELLGLQYWDLALAAGKSQQALADVLAGRGTVNLQTLAAVAGALGMGVVIDFIPLAEEPAVDAAAELRRRLAPPPPISQGA